MSVDWYSFHLPLLGTTIVYTLVYMLGQID